MNKQSAMKAQNARRQAKLERIMTERREKLKKSRTLEKLEQENKRLFSLLDTEGDGAVDVKELAVFLKSIKANARYGYMRVCVL